MTLKRLLLLLTLTVALGVPAISDCNRWDTVTGCTKQGTYCISGCGGFACQMVEYYCPNYGYKFQEGCCPEGCAIV